MTMRIPLQAISLFSGAGGDTLGLERAGFTVVAFNEFNAAAASTHRIMFPSSTELKSPTSSANIKDIPNSVFDPYRGHVSLVFAGFPCQGFSHAGKKRSDDARNELVFEFARVAEVVQPEWIIGENVKGLLSRKGRDPDQPATAPLRPVIDIIRDLFERKGYRITYRLLDVAADIGVPQRRKRVIIVGHRVPVGGRRGPLYPHMPWDELTETAIPFASPTAIRPFLEPHLCGAVRLPALYAPHDQPAHFWIPTRETAAPRLPLPHPNLLRLVEGIRNSSSKERAEKPETPRTLLEPAGLISFGVRKGGYHGMIVNPDVPCNTIISTYNLCPRLFVGLRGPTGYWIRCMTVAELGQIQGFPADYRWQGTEKQQIAQIGNAVPPPLAERVVRSLSRVVFRSEPQRTDAEGAESEEEEMDE